MSYSFSPRPAQSHDEHLLSQSPLGHGGEEEIQGQRHDRIQFQERNTATMPGSGDFEITTTQRMMSATVGSVLTSLLGKS